MGDEKKPLPGKTSGVTAQDLVPSPDIGAVAPGRTELVQGQEFGDQWLDHGAKCDGKDESTPGCFWSDAKRSRVIVEFKHLVANAKENYKFALVELKVEELMKEEEDLNWVLTLALDVAGAHLLVVASKALKGVKGAALERLSEIGGHAAGQGTASESALSSRAGRLLRSISDSRIDSLAKAGFSQAQKGASKQAQKALNPSAAGDKKATLSFIDQLRDGCDSAFGRFQSNAVGHSSDAELEVLLRGMNEDLHTVGEYKSVLEAKLSRFRKSGVPHIGTKSAKGTRVRPQYGPP